MRILIADAQPLMVKGIAEVISIDMKDKLYEAYNLSDAIQILQNKKIDLMIMGLQLEKEDGFELIRRSKNISDAKILVLASSANLNYFTRARELGVDGYLLKNSKVEDFLYAFKVVQRGDHFYDNYLLEKSIHNRGPKELEELTEREREVFYLLCSGISNSEIGKRLYISEATIKKHISNILNKLHLSNRIEVIFWANKISENQYQSRG